jgi:hypothetical protein
VGNDSVCRGNKIVELGGVEQMPLGTAQHVCVARAPTTQVGIGALLECLPGGLVGAGQCERELTSLVASDSGVWW